MDDDENEKQLYENLRVELAAQKVAMLEILRILDSVQPTASIIVVQELATMAQRLGELDPELSEALGDLSDEISLRS